jgi:endonuclease YncB( thermonuclease family)
MRENIILLITIILATALAAVGQKLPKVTMVQGHVLSIDDSDRLTFVSKEGTIYAASLLAADAPDKDQNSYKKARKKLSDLLEDKEITAAVHTTDEGKFVAAVFVDGQDVSLKLIQDGLAWYYPVHSRELTASEREKYTLAEVTARTAKVGLWDEKVPVAPWIFRGEKLQTEPAQVETAATEPSQPKFLTSNETQAVPGRKYILGPRGGCYYLNESGYKVYVKDKSLCGVKPQ